MAEIKICRGCWQSKPLSEFNRARGYGDGVYTHCKTCVAVRRKAYREAQHFRIGEHRKEIIAPISAREAWGDRSVAVCDQKIVPALTSLFAQFGKWQ